MTQSLSLLIGLQNSLLQASQGHYWYVGPSRGHYQYSSEVS